MTVEIKLFSNFLGFFVQLLKNLTFQPHLQRTGATEVSTPVISCINLYITCCHTHRPESAVFEYTMVVL
jgi:hypothetical protein